MMKKFLVLLMVLGMVTMANAQLQISVNGDLEPVDSMITVAPSDHLVLDIWNLSQITAGLNDNFYWALVVNTDKATIDYLTGVIVTQDNGIVLEHGMSAKDMGYPIPEGTDGISGGITLNQLPNIPAGSIIYDLIDFHCVAFGDAIIQLYETPDGSVLTLVDTVIIHQIPEPMTMALLGLGGLFLRRRK